MPAILDPLIDIAAHIVKTKGVCLEATNLERLCGIIGVDASLTIRHTLLELLPPPIVRIGACPGSVFPLRLAGQSEAFLRSLGKPCQKLLGIGPAQICYGGIVVTARNVLAHLSGHALVPLANGDWEFAYLERFDCHSVHGGFRLIGIATHRKSSARKRQHFWGSDWPDLRLFRYR